MRQDRISQDSAIMAGKPVVKGTRIPVEVVLGKLAEDPNLDELFAAYPRLTVDDVKACLAYAKELARSRAGADRVQRAVDSMGAWADLDFDEMLVALDQIRHESKPTPPIENL